MPFYQQLYEVLRNKISVGEWMPGDLLPPEAEITTQYGVSRVTARQALEALVNEGLIYRQRGKGTFVSHPTVEQGLTRIVSFSEDMRQRRFTPGTELLFSGLIPAPEDIAAKLNIAPGTELARIDRLRLADSEPMGVEEAFFVHDYCPGLLECDYKSRSLREVMEVTFNVIWSRAKQTIQAVGASADKAQKLTIKVGAPLLLIERVSYSQQDIPVEFLRISHRGDRYVLYNELRG